MSTNFQEQLSEFSGAITRIDDLTKKVNSHFEVLLSKPQTVVQSFNASETGENGFSGFALYTHLTEVGENWQSLSWGVMPAVTPLHTEALKVELFVAQLGTSISEVSVDEQDTLRAACESSLNVLTKNREQLTKWINDLRVIKTGTVKGDSSKEAVETAFSLMLREYGQISLSLRAIAQKLEP